jgi:hypothetical protein
MQTEYGPIPAGDWVFPAGETVDLFDAWAFAEADAHLAFHAWRLAEVEERADAYVVYRAALDREETAANVLAERLNPVRGLKRWLPMPAR